MLHIHLNILPTYRPRPLPSVTRATGRSGAALWPLLRARLGVLCPAAGGGACWRALRGAVQPAGGRRRPRGAVTGGARRLRTAPAARVAGGAVRCAREGSSATSATPGYVREGRGAWRTGRRARRAPRRRGRPLRQRRRRLGRAATDGPTDGRTRQRQRGRRGGDGNDDDGGRGRGSWEGSGKLGGGCGGRCGGGCGEGSSGGGCDGGGEGSGGGGGGEGSAKACAGWMRLIARWRESERAR